MRFINSEADHIQEHKTTSGPEYEQDLFWWGLQKDNIEDFVTPFMQDVLESLRHCEIKKFPAYQHSFCPITHLSMNPTLFFTGADGSQLFRLLKEFSKRHPTPKSELNFYLYEPFSYIKRGRVRRWIEGSQNSKEEHEISNDGFCDTSVWEKKKALIPSELMVISNWLKENNIESATVWTSDYNASHFEDRYKNLKIKCVDYFLKHMATNPNTYRPCYEIVSKRFFCATKRYALHRHLLSAFLADTESKNMSWHYRLKNDQLFDKEMHSKKGTFFEVDRLAERYQDRITKGAKTLKHKRFVLDIDFDSALELDSVTQYLNFPSGAEVATQSSNLFDKKAQECFVSIVGETKYGVPTANFTEKVLNPMKLYRPYIVAAPPYTLEYIRKLGFKTFDRWWSEDYDKIENHTERLNAVFNIIEDLEKKSIEELQKILIEMEEVLNWNVFMYQTLPFNPVIL
jgi:hypothetical protein